MDFLKKLKASLLDAQDASKKCPPMELPSTEELKQLKPKINEAKEFFRTRGQRGSLHLFKDCVFITVTRLKGDSIPKDPLQIINWITNSESLIDSAIADRQVNEVIENTEIVNIDVAPSWWSKPLFSVGTLEITPTRLLISTLVMTIVRRKL